MWRHDKAAVNWFVVETVTGKVRITRIYIFVYFNCIVLLTVFWSSEVANDSLGRLAMWRRSETAVKLVVQETVLEESPDHYFILFLFV